MPATLPKSIDDLLQAATAAGEDGVPGVAAIITRSTGNVYEGSAGVTDVGKPDTPFTIDTIVWIASMTKAMTAVAVLQCVERGMIGLDDDLSPILPELHDLRVIDRSLPFEDGNYTLRPATVKITLRRLLTHSSGLIYSHQYDHSKAYCKKNGIPPTSAATRDVYKYPSFHEAGTEWHYGMGIDYAGLVVETLVNDRLGHYFEANIRKPLGMSSTVFNLTPALLPRKATMHERTASGKAVPMADPWPHKVEKDMGGGGLWSTVSDYAKFVRMLLSDGKTSSGHAILKPETLRMAMEGHLEPEAKASCNEIHKDTTLSKFPGAKRDYGLIGMVFEEDLLTGRTAGSIQWSGVANCHWSVDTKKDIGLVLCTQIMPSGDPHVQKLLRAVETAAYDALS